MCMEPSILYYGKCHFCITVQTVDCLALLQFDRFQHPSDFGKNQESRKDSGMH